MSLPKILLITGANSGVGYEAVKAFLESVKPYHILLGSRSLAKAESAVNTLRQEVPNATNTVEPLCLDVTSDESIDQALEQVKASRGHIDVLINNAGIKIPPWPRC